MARIEKNKILYPRIFFTGKNYLDPNNRIFCLLKNSANPQILKILLNLAEYSVLPEYLQN